MKNNKGFVHTNMIIITLVVIIVVGLAYQLGKNSSKNVSDDYQPVNLEQDSQNQNVAVNENQPTNEQTKPVISTNNWKTYTSIGCGYSFQYPNTWSQSGKESSVINLQNTIMGRTVDFIDTASVGIETNDGKSNQIYAPKDNMHVACYTMGTANYNDELARYNNSSDLFSQTKKIITIDGQTAIVGEMKNTATVSSGDHAGRAIIPSHDMYVFFMHKDQTRSLYFKFSTPINSNDTNEIATFEKLLSTFKFN